MFFLESNGEVAQITIRDFTIRSIIVPKSLSKFAIYAENLVRSQIEHLFIHSNDSKSYPVAGGIAMAKVADTNTVRDVIFMGNKRDWNTNRLWFRSSNLRWENCWRVGSF